MIAARTLLLCLIVQTALPQQPGAVREATAERPGELIIRSESTAVRLRLYAADIVRVDYLSRDSVPAESSLVVIREPATGLSFTVVESDSILICSTNGYALYFDNYSRGWFDLGESDSGAFTYTAAEGELSVYCIAAQTIPRQLERYTWLTGRQPLPPRWAFGFLQSKNRYRNEAEVRSVAQNLRQRDFPCDAIVLDLAWFKQMGDLSWDTAAWPNHRGLVDDLRADGMRTILITEPYLTEQSSGFEPAAARGYLASDSSGKVFLLDRWWSCGGCVAALLDMTNPEARRWWWERHSAAFGSSGRGSVAGIWTDLGEPERHPEGMRHFLGSAARIHNIYNATGGIGETPEGWRGILA